MRHCFFVILLILVCIFIYSNVYAIDDIPLSNDIDNIKNDSGNDLGPIDNNKKEADPNLDSDNTNDSDLQGINNDVPESNNNDDNSLDSSNSSDIIDDKDYVEELEVSEPAEQLETNDNFVSIGYFDEDSYDSGEVENPETSDSIYIYILLFLISPVLIVFFTRKLIN